MIEVIHIKNYGRYKRAGYSMFRIGRPSVLGNPFHIGRDGTREQVIELYRQHLWGKLHYNETDYVNAVETIIATAQKHPVALVCFCKPKACHGDVIKNIVEQIIEGRRDVS